MCAVASDEFGITNMVKFVAGIEKRDPVAGVREDALHGVIFGLP
jgi:hypothetical protein